MSNQPLSADDVEWAAFLIGKIKADELGPTNQLRLAQREAIKEAQKIVGDPGLKPFPGGIVNPFGDDDD